MAGAAANHGHDALSPSVRELVDQVRARAESTAKPEEIRVLAQDAAEAAHGKIRTVEEVEDLFDLAMARMGEIDTLMLELAALTGDQGG